MLRKWPRAAFSVVLGAGLCFSQEPTVIRVWTYNVVRLTDDVLAQSQQEAAAVLREAGVETSWVTCALSTEEASENPACLTPWCPTDLQMILTDQEMMLPRKIPKGVLGLSSPDSDHARIVCDRVRLVAANRGIPLPSLLGRMMAHEVGHLLLGSTKHQLSGIMRGTWGDWELNAGTQRLRFRTGEAAALRRNAAERALSSRSCRAGLPSSAR